jgi:hypothetical protein
MKPRGPFKVMGFNKCRQALSTKKSQLPIKLTCLLHSRAKTGIFRGKWAFLPEGWIGNRPFGKKLVEK